MYMHIYIYIYINTELLDGNQGHQEETLIEAEWRIYVSVHWVSIGADSGLSPIRRQAII